MNCENSLIFMLFFFVSNTFINNEKFTIPLLLLSAILYGIAKSYSQLFFFKSIWFNLDIVFQCDKNI